MREIYPLPSRPSVPSPLPPFPFSLYSPCLCSPFDPRLSSLPFPYAQYTLPMRLSCRVSSRRRCVLHFRSMGPLNADRGSGRALRSHQAGSGAEPQPKSNLVHFSHKIWYLVSTILTILLSARDARDFCDAAGEREMDGWKYRSLPRDAGDLVGLMSFEDYFCCIAKFYDDYLIPRSTTWFSVMTLNFDLDV